MKGKIKRRQPQKPSREDNSRKSLRKQKRQLKKANRHHHYTKAKITAKPEPVVGRFVKRPADSDDHEEATPKIKKIKSIPSAQELANEERKRELKKEQKLQKEMDDQRRKMLLQANEDEDKIIKKLEKQLGINKTKNKKNVFTSDGLDYVLEVCDRNTQEQLAAAQKHLADVDAEADFEEDLANVTQSSQPSKKNKNRTASQTSEDESIDEAGDEMDDFDEIGSEDDGNSEDDDTPEPDFIRSESKKHTAKRKGPETVTPKSAKIKAHQLNTKPEDLGSEQHSNEDSVDDDSIDDDSIDDDNTHSSSDEENGEIAQENQTNGETEHVVKEKPDVWEDIYGRKRDKEGNVLKEEKGTYVPPHLRNITSSVQSQELIQLKRQIKGVLNKLAGTNLHWACATVEALYAGSSRNAVDTALSDLWSDAVVQLAATPDRMMAEHAAMLSVLHANVGTEVGAHFLQVLVKKFDEMLTNQRQTDGKELENLTAALAYLYSFKIYQASLLYELLTRLLDDVSEQRVGCVLAALRAVGGALRRDQPLALKSFIHDTQARLAALTHSAAAGSRIKFLLEVLMAVKNNNLTKIPNYDPSYSEDLKKLTRGIIRKGNYVTTLNIGLEDLLKADERGKWWVVGSAWEGGVTAGREALTAAPTPSSSADARLLRLAREQRMNTDIRRSIFCIIMSAQDYTDAFEKLQRLGLKHQQEREVVHVLLACCLQERSYNPYYGVLAQKLCEHDRKLQLSIQYSVWDKIKDLENTSKLQAANLAHFLTHLIMEKGLPISVLKVMEFSDLSKATVRFMRQILLAIIMNENLQSCLEVFQRISAAPKLHMFRESLRLFIQHFLIRNAGKKTNVLSDEEMATLKERAQQVEKILSMNDSKLRL